MWTRNLGSHKVCGFSSLMSSSQVRCPIGHESENWPPGGIARGGSCAGTVLPAGDVPKEHHSPLTVLLLYATSSPGGVVTSSLIGTGMAPQPSMETTHPNRPPRVRCRGGVTGVVRRKHGVIHDRTARPSMSTAVKATERQRDLDQVVERQPDVTGEITDAPSRDQPHARQTHDARSVPRCPRCTDRSISNAESSTQV